MDGFDTLLAILIATIRAGTPLVFAAIGELVTEKSGVLNLGIEGMMLIGAVTGFIFTVLTGNPYIGILAAMVAGVAISLIFGVLTLSLMTNQVATGLALTIFGIGLSAFVGLAYIGTPIDGLDPIAIPVLSEIPVLGPLLFNHDIMIYGSILLFVVVSWFLYRTRAGLILRAVGESHDAAHAIGYSVLKIRYLAVMFGGAMSGIAGAYLSLVYTPQWAENMTAGRGWIALALVVFATWRPGRVLAGAYLFGFITISGLHVQALGYAISSHLMAMLPYLATVLVLVIISRDATKIRLNAPASLGRPFHPTA
ncbi:MAG: ABC transporter permease [Alphaproteobacteria bacterium]|nr:ABC transporter permease [Alphaproteobacteria bacterium]